jgi:hypothetical protein
MIDEKMLIDRLEEEMKGHLNLYCDGLIKAMSIAKDLASEHNNGWIPCSERLPQENETIDAVCEVVNVMMKSGTVTSGWCNRYLKRWYVLDEHCDYPLQQNYEDVIAWQPLPAPYKKGE